MMVRENVDIVFRESGIRVIKRNLDELGESANRATRGVFLLQRALFVLGGFGITRALIAQADALTNLENRLRLTTNSSVELQQVQTELFAIARRSRADLEGVAQTYTRTALSAKALGRSQEEVLKFTESVTKAAVLSGASTREINASLIQLGQGIASNRLGGDELRSILEQLPLVADIIAKELGVTRGQLRELGSEGKITGDIILDAFKNAADEIDALFANTQPTIEQAFTVARTNFLEFLDTFDDATGASAKLANAIIFVSQNIDLLVRSAAVLAGLLALSFAGSVLTSIFTYANGLRATAVQATAVLNRLVAIRGATVANTAAQVAANASRQAQLTQNLALIAQKKALLQQEVLEAQFVVRNGQARNIQTGQFVRLSAAKANLARLTQQLSIVEGVEAAQAARLTQARAAQAGATNALAGAQARLGAAQAAQAGLGARLAAQFPLLAGAINAARVALGGLWALLAANPITAVISLIAALVIGIVAFGDKIEFASLGFVTLKDLAVASLQLISEALAPFLGPIWDFIKNAVSTVGSAIGSAFSTAATVIAQVVTTIIDTVTFLPRVVIAIVAGINAAWDSIPAAAGAAIDKLTDMFATGMEFIANLGIKAVNKIIEAFNGLAGTKVGELLGIDAAELIPEATFDNLRTNFGGSGKAAGDAFSSAFTSSLESTRIENIVGSIGSQIVQRAQENAATARSDRMLQEMAAQRAAEEAAANNIVPGDVGGGGGGGGGGAQQADFASKIAAMQQEIQLLQLGNRERKIAQELINIEKELKRGLTDQERELAVATIQQLEAARQQAEVLESIVGPREKAIEQMTALNALFQQGRISVQEYAAAVLEMGNALNAASGTLMGGFKAAIGESIMNVSEFGKAIGGQFVGFVNSAADAIVEFARTGKLNIKQLFAELFANLLKLAAQQLLLRLLGSFLGIPGGGIGLGTPVGFATGGSILPSGPGTTDSQLVQFKKRPDERVDILTPQQQKAQANAMAGGGGTTVVQSPPVNVAAVLSPGDIVGAFDNSDGETVVVNMISRNASTIKRILG
jgi:tape measure domain-containing protein